MITHLDDDCVRCGESPCDCARRRTYDQLWAEAKALRANREAVTLGRRLAETHREATARSGRWLQLVKWNQVADLMWTEIGAEVLNYGATDSVQDHAD